MCKLPLLTMRSGLKMDQRTGCKSIVRGDPRGWLGQNSRGLKCHPEVLGPCPRLLGTHRRGRLSYGWGKTLWGPCEGA